MNSCQRLFFCAFFCLLLVLNPNFYVLAQKPNISLSSLKQGQIINGFRTKSIYLNNAEQPVGGRFIHERTGFTLDLVEIQSIPQAFIWVNSFPVSDQGEPHTQEHLLITKGNKGRNLNSFENMSMANSTAGTYQYYTIYGIDTSAGNEVFYNYFQKYLDALLHPDYSDEEIRREVRNWGITENADKTFRLEEKGSVYNEMSSSSKNQFSRIYDRMAQLIYGEAHPLSYDAGGTPTGIGTMKPEDIKRFHAANYHLGNMGAIVSVPKAMPSASVLKRMNLIFNQLEPKPIKRSFMSVDKMPPFKPAETGKIQITEYPDENEKQAGTMLFGYPAMPELDLTERFVLANFLGYFTNGTTANLYKKFIATQTREFDLGGKGISASLQTLPGNPVYFSLTDVSPEYLNEEKANIARQKIMDEIARFAEYPDQSAEVKEFNTRVLNGLNASKRSASRLFNTPPGFSSRNSGSGNNLLLNLNRLDKSKDFRKSITGNPQVAELEKMLLTGKNFWRDYIAKWKLTTVKPYITVSKANPKLIEQDNTEKKSRADAEVENLKKKYNLTDAQAAIRRYQAEYDAQTAELEKLEKSAKQNFIANPPLTLDDGIDYKLLSINNLPFVASYFDSMPGATTGLAMRADVVSEDELVYLTMMPSLLRNVGVVKDGKPLSFEETTELIRKEILSVSVSFGVNYDTNRFELIARGSGNDLAESEKAIEWMKLILQHPNWRKENLPRIRDLVDQSLSGFRRIMQGSEESWVINPSTAYRFQDNPYYLSTYSSFTMAHNVHRLRWMLKDSGNQENQKAISDFLTKLAQAKGNRQELKSLLGAIQGDKSETTKVKAELKLFLDDFAKLPETAGKLAIEAAKDLTITLSDIPDETLTTDWNYLCRQMQRDLAQTPEKTLENLDKVRRKLLNAQNARMFYIGSSANQRKLENNYQNLLASFEKINLQKINYPKVRRIEERIKERYKTVEKPVFVGLIAPNMNGGVFINEAPSVKHTDTSREKLLDYLAGNIHGGSGPKSVYTLTLNAGLAYSNGIGNSPDSGRIMYYAERTPELPQTLQYVIEQIKKPYYDEAISEYVIAMAFYSRSGSSYESRGEAMANNLADGLTPEVVRKFRQSILDLRKIPNLSTELFNRKDKVYGQVLPGYGIKGKDVAGANYFVIGAEKQMIAYENYLKAKDSPQTKLYRIYPRDFWMPMK